MRISDWSSDVCSSDLCLVLRQVAREEVGPLRGAAAHQRAGNTGDCSVLRLVSDVLQAAPREALAHAVDVEAELAGLETGAGGGLLLLAGARLLQHGGGPGALGGAHV